MPNLEQSILKQLNIQHELRQMQVHRMHMQLDACRLKAQGGAALLTACALHQRYESGCMLQSQQGRP